MKTITSDYKNNIKLLGRQLDSKIIYTLNNQEITLGNEDLNSVTPHYEGTILKSVMKCLDIDSNINIPVGTVLEYKLGILIENEYEYISFGNYIVEKVEKQEDTNSYKITCYDKMLNAMKDYEQMNITYPITIRNYINAICNKINIGFENLEDTFANYNKQIQNELYLDVAGNSLGYTFRDVLDEIAQVTGSIICINNDDKLEVRYINDTSDTIDEEYLKNINVNFEKKYGPINSVVLSRSAETDNVYLRDEESIQQYGLCEVKIVDNQIMNFNDRSDYLPDILYQLLGTEYYINDFSSTGITYYDLYDKYNVQINNVVYPCLMLNDEINVTQGLEENIHTDIPKESVTDYTKADKTDRRINQTYLIVDKQNQKIESVVSSTAEQNTKISQLTQTVDELNSRIQEIADISTSGETVLGSLQLSNVLSAIPILIKIHPIGNNIDYLYPYSTLYPSSTLYPKERKIRFTNTRTNEIFEYEIPNGLLSYSSELYDEFYLSGDSETCQVIKRCGYNSDGTVSALAEQETITYPFPYDELTLTDGDYNIEILGYGSAYLYVRLLAENLYTTMYPTKIEMRSEITQTKNDITLEVDEKLDDYSTTTEMNSAINIKANEINQTVSTKVGKNEIISSINQTAETIKINASKINLTGYVTINDLSTSGQTTINGGNITTGTISTSRLQSDVITTNNFSAQNINANKITAGTLNVDRINAKSITGAKIADTTITGNKINTSNFVISNDRGAFDMQNGILRVFYKNGGSAILSNAVRLSATAGVGISSNSNGNIGAPSTNIDLKACNDASVYLGSMGNGTGTSENTGFTITPSQVRSTRSITVVSDKRFKKNIKDLKDVTWIDELKIKEFDYKKESQSKSIGLIAQDYIGKEYNKYFLETDEKGYYAISYGNITNALIQYCQELKKEVNDLKERINNE